VVLIKILAEKSENLSGRVNVPSSKSHTLRAVIFGAIASGKTIIRNTLISPDAKSCVKACRLLGAEIDESDDKEWTVEGTGGGLKAPEEVIDVGNSGIALRLISGVASNCNGSLEITGDESICSNRPMEQVIKAINDLGGYAAAKRGNGYAPLVIKGPIKGGFTEIKGEDSQPVSACMFASLLCKEDVEIKVNDAGEKPWIGMNLSWFDKLGLKYRHKDYEHYWFKGKQEVKGFDTRIPGDFSSAAFPLAAGVMVPGSKIELNGLDMNDVQGDKEIVNVLKRMGAKIDVSEGKIVVENSKLKGIEIDVNELIDAVPILAVIGCYADGKTVIKNAGVARKKESDRLNVMVKELRKMGAKIEEFEDSIVVEKSKLYGAEVDAHNDHRVALALAVAGMTAEGKTIIKGAECIEKTYGSFPKDVNGIGANIQTRD